MSGLTPIAATTRIYYQNSYKNSCIASLVAFAKDQVGSYAICNQTIFHPQGGGQPSDSGTLQLGSKQVKVIKLEEDKNSGIIKHYLDEVQLKEVGEEIQSLVGKKITQTIDIEKRILFAQQHTGGHLLANIVESLDPRLEGYNGYHFPEGPYVKFKIKPTEQKTESKDSKTESKAEPKKEPQKTKKGEKGGANASFSFTKEQVEKLATQYIADKLSIHVDNTTTPRTVQIKGLKTYPCGGTHLSGIDELGALRVREIKKDKNDIKIKYEVGIKKEEEKENKMKHKSGGKE